MQREESVAAHGSIQSLIQSQSTVYVSYRRGDEHRRRDMWREERDGDAERDIQWRERRRKAPFSRDSKDDHN